MKTQAKPYNDLSTYYQNLFGEKVYKIAIDAGLTCPNRDGKLDTRGCIFCSEGGSGDFTPPNSLNITAQIEQGKLYLAQKNTGSKFIAYFQAFTNTYGELSDLRKIYEEALSHPDIIGLSIATRPDCLSDAIVQLLSELNQKKKIWVELGLQTIHPSTTALIRRGYALDCYDGALSKLNAYQIDAVVHLIIGLPYESPEAIMETVQYVGSQNIQGIKLQLLHVLKGTDLATLYLEKGFEVLTSEAYVELVIDCLELLPKEIVIHRLTGDGPKQLLMAPLWSQDKKKVLNTLHKRMHERGSYQGKLLSQTNI